MSVGRICCREVQVASPNESVLDAARRMHTARVGTLVVLNERREPVGLVTDRDLVTRAMAGEKNPNTTRLSEVMTPAPKTIVDDSPIESAVRLMRAAKCRRLPVVNRQEQLVGILSLDDVLALLVEELNHVGGILEGQSP